MRDVRGDGVLPRGEIEAGALLREKGREISKVVE